MSAAGALDRLMSLPSVTADGAAAVATALASASAAIARLDQALAGHPLRQAFLFRARLEAVRQQAAVDGDMIDPWHLAAGIEGLRFRMDPYLPIIERGRIFDAARAALTLHQWLVEPDFDQEGDVQRAEAMLATQSAALPPLLAAAQGFRQWIDGGEARAPLRAALVRYWTRRYLLRVPIPLTGAVALRAEVSWEADAWIPAFLRALEKEAAHGLDLLTTLERAWLDARALLGHRRTTSHAASAVDLLAATPLMSATTLAGALGIAVKNAIRILDQLCAAGIALELTHRSKRRLFGLSGLARLRDAVAPPYRPNPNRGPGRPRNKPIDDEVEPVMLPLPSVSPIERRAFDYSVLEEATAHLDAVIRRARQTFNAIIQHSHQATTE
jgi:hypothetical protein